MKNLDTIGIVISLMTLSLLLGFNIHMTYINIINKKSYDIIEINKMACIVILILIIIEFIIYTLREIGAY